MYTDTATSASTYPPPCRGALSGAFPARQQTFQTSTWRVLKTPLGDECFRENVAWLLGRPV
eukprot:8662144-Pyramimonas_sp.AAC.1